MAFIQSSVGKDGKNDEADVKIIVELILRAHANKPFLTQPTVDSLGKSGRLLAIGVNQAVEEFVKYAAESRSILKIPEAQKMALDRSVIYPDDPNYKILLACAICGNRKPTAADFDQNPLLKKAFNNAVSYLTFKQAIASGSFCNDSVNSQSTEEKLDEATIEILRKNLEKLYSNEIFKSFIEAVIVALPSRYGFTIKADKYTGTILENFDRVKNSRGYWIDLLGYAQAEYRRGKITFKRDKFRPSSTVPIAFRFNEGGKLSMVTNVSTHVKNSQATEALDTTLVLVHELIHAHYSPLEVPTGIEHDHMDEAARTAIGKLGIQSIIPFKKEFGAEYFTAVLRQVCGNIKL